MQTADSMSYYAVLHRRTLLHRSLAPGLRVNEFDFRGKFFFEKRQMNSETNAWQGFERLFKKSPTIFRRAYVVTSCWGPALTLLYGKQCHFKHYTQAAKEYTPLS
jgi:hypothetical protein